MVFGAVPIRTAGLALFGNADLRIFLRSGFMKQGRKKIRPESYRERTYRQSMEQGDLISCLVQIRETDLHIQADRDVSKRASELVLQSRLQIEGYIADHPDFLTSLVPLPADALAPPVVRDMLQASETAGVGPMAAVAGSIAAFVGKTLIDEGVGEIIVENGGDIFLSRRKDCTIAIFAGQSVLSNKVGLALSAGQMPCGVCTSSGTVGHSLSLGKADSVTVVAESAAFADAVATLVGNEVGGAGGGKAGINRALEKVKGLDGVRGVVVICGDLLGAVGDVQLVRLG
jgi:ApbE superfamily uncharacterized protein (UPF0280 family)